jgi:pyruvate,water dikinase
MIARPGFPVTPTRLPEDFPSMEHRITVADDEPSERFPVFTRGNVGEVFAEVVSPLTWTALGRLAWEPAWRDAFCDFGAFTHDEFKPEGQPEITACFGGYVYINMSVTRVLAVRIPGMTVEAIDRSLFGDAPDVPPYRPDPRDENAERTAAAGAWLTSLFSDDPQPLNDANRADLSDALASRPDPGTMTDADLAAAFRASIPRARLLFRQHVRNTYGANVLVGAILQFCEAAGRMELASSIASMLGDVDSAAQSFELWDLSRVVRSSPGLMARFDRDPGSVPADAEAAGDRDARTFLQGWSRFLDRWGFLGPNAWDLRSPTYRASPDLVLRMLDRMRHAQDAAAPQHRADEAVARREEAIAEVSERLPQEGGARAQFEAAARAAARFLAAREGSKVNCARWNEATRALMRELGGRYASRGVLDGWEDVLMISFAELDDFMAQPAAFRDRIAERARQMTALAHRVPPFVFEGTPPPLSAYRERAGAAAAEGGLPAGTVLTGIGVSPGVRTGRVRLIASLDTDSDLAPDEIIVAETTDASWGPLFLSAAAVIVETGAAISHAAIVSRELGIPAVVSVAGVTRRLADGTVVTVDGGAGTVTVQ